MRILLYIALIIIVVLSVPVVSCASETHYKDGDIIASDTTWQGRVVVEGVVFIPEGVTLTIEPGTVVAFNKSNASYSESGTSEVLIPGSGIRVEGRIIADGRRDGWITFTSSMNDPAPGYWGCLFFDHSKGSVFRYCRMEYSAYTLHSHFSSFDVSRCIITNNEDGSRLGVSRASFDHCDILNNTGKGLNFRQCRNTVTNCNITGNREGIFLNEKDAVCAIENNNIYDNNGMDLRLGEFHAEDVKLAGNWWGTADATAIKAHVYDKEDDPAIGSAVNELAKAKVIGAGVDGISMKVNWKYKTGGFVDSSPAFDNGMVYFGSWDKSLYALKADTGELAWKFAAGDCVDSSPAVSDGKVYFGSWDRNIYGLSARDGSLIWKFRMPPSNFDDHRQASPAVMAGVVFMGGFGGEAYALDAGSGAYIVSYQTRGSVRSRPFTYKYKDTMRVLISSESGSIYCLEFPSNRSSAKHIAKKGFRRVWFYKTRGPVASSPVLVNGQVYVGSRDGNIYCLDAETGGKHWSYPTGGSIEYSSPLIVDGLVLIGSTDKKLYAIDRAKGTLAWSFDGGGVIYSSPISVGNRVVYGDNDGNVYFLDSRTGSPVGLFRAGGPVQALSVGPDGVLYAGSRDGYLYALSAEE